MFISGQIGNHVLMGGGPSRPAPGYLLFDV